MKFVRRSSEAQSLRAFTPHLYAELSQTRGVKISRYEEERLSSLRRQTYREDYLVAAEENSSSAIQQEEISIDTNRNSMQV